MEKKFMQTTRPAGISNTANAAPAMTRIATGTQCCQVAVIDMSEVKPW
ncbi:hypothetical protein AVAK2825_16835 [Acidovorax sp. SUPP2825]|nr:hypothetical protein AVAK2825_16835 [Acidovorax sp. SUPP2825]